MLDSSASESTPAGVDRLRTLLSAYHEAVWAAVDAPRVVFLRRSDHGIGRFIRLPRPRLLLRYFVVQHVHRRLDELERRFSALAALADDRKASAHLLELIADFRRSLPTRVSRKLLAALSIVVVLLAVRILSEQLFDISRAEDKKELELLVQLQASLLSFNVRGGFLNALASTPFKVVLDLLSGLLLCTYAVLRVAYPGFRLKRALFNVLPEGVGRLKQMTVRDLRARSHGLYALEREVFAALGARTTPEFPFDLFVSSLLAGLWTGIGISYLWEADYGGSAFVVSTGLLRFAWLGRVWRQRVRDKPQAELQATPAPS